MHDIIIKGKWLSEWIEENKQKSHHQYANEAWELIRNGWRFEIPSGDYDYEAWQWCWRSPPKRKGSNGRLYLSTNQALNALRKSQ